MKMYLHTEVEFFFRYSGMEEVYKGTVTHERGDWLTVYIPKVDHSAEIHVDDLVEQDDYGFSDETEERIIKWEGEN